MMTIKQHVNRDFFSKVWRLAIPVSLQMILFSSRNMIDVMMVGQIGEKELAAVGLVAAAYMVAFHLIWGLVSGIDILGAQHFGAKNLKGVQKTVAQGMMIALAFVIPIVVLFLVFPEFIVSIATDKQELIPLGADYLVITAFTLVTAGISVSFQTGLNCIGKPKINLLFTFIGVASNIFLNWVLIFGNLGMPALGLNGAAIATMIASTVELIAVLVYFYGTKHFLAVSLKNIRESVNKTEIKRFLKISIPLTAGGIAWSTGAFVYHAIYGHMGTVELAVMTMLEPLAAICFSFFWGISSATRVIMGHHLGANEFEQAWVRSWVLVLLGFLFSCIAAIGIWLAHEPIFKIYGAVEASTLALAVEVLIILLLTTWSRAVNVVGIVGVLQSGGDNNFILKMDVVCQWAVGIPLAYLAAFYWQLPLQWVFLAACAEEIVKLLFWIPRMYSRIWIKNLVTEPGSPEAVV